MILMGTIAQNMRRNAALSASGITRTVCYTSFGQKSHWITINTANS